MKRFDMKQRSPEWFAVRAGVITASRMSECITNTRKPSSAIQGYINQLIDEGVTGEIEEIPQNYAMKRGTDLEPEAFAYYVLETGNEMEVPGFCMHDDYKIGCSPDGLGPDRGLEIKCPGRRNHVGFLRDNKCPDQYYGQVQLGMWITGLDKWDFISYSDRFPEQLIVTVERDQDYIDLLVNTILIPAHDTIQEFINKWRQD